MSELSYFPTWMKFIPLLEKYSIQRAKNEIGIADSHAYSLVAHFEQKGWIIRHKEGRGYVITLTPEGKRLAKKCKSIMKVVEDVP